MGTENSSSPRVRIGRYDNNTSGMHVLGPTTIVYFIMITHSRANRVPFSAESNAFRDRFHFARRYSPTWYSRPCRIAAYYGHRRVWWGICGRYVCTFSRRRQQKLDTIFNYRRRCAYTIGLGEARGCRQFDSTQLFPPGVAKRETRYGSGRPGGE